MFNSLPADNTFSIDIETVPLTLALSSAPARIRDLWEARCLRKDRDGLCDPAAKWPEEAALIPEFAKVVCVVVGHVMTLKDRPATYRYARFVLLPDSVTVPMDRVITDEVSTYYFPQESELLRILAVYLDRKMNDKSKLVAHSGFNFDFAVLTRRLLIHGYMPPKCLRTIDLKPWESQLVDTKQLLSFGSRSFEHRITLDEWCGSLDIPSPKDQISGKDVWVYFYTRVNGYQAVADYCQRDVEALAAGLEKMRNLHDTATAITAENHGEI